jgi:hypothetical protein
MLNSSKTAPKQTSEDREARVQAILQRLQPDAELVLRRMAEDLADLPEDRLFGAIEAKLRDHAHDLAASAHQAGLDASKKRGT